jgi:hypothetical protein
MNIKALIKNKQTKESEAVLHFKEMQLTFRSKQTMKRVKSGTQEHKYDNRSSISRETPKNKVLI